MSYDIQISVLAAKMAAILEKLHLQAIATTGDRFAELEIIQIDSCDILSLHNFLW